MANGHMDGIALGNAAASLWDLRDDRSA